MESLFTQKSRLLSPLALKTLFLLLLTFIFASSYAQQSIRTYANDIQKSNDQYLLVIKAGYVTDQQKAVDGDVKTYTELNSTIVNVLGIKLGGEATVRLRFTGNKKPAPNSPVTVKLGIGGNLLSVLGGLTVQAINGAQKKNDGSGNEVGSVHKAQDLLNLISGDQTIEFTFIPGVAYDGVKIKLGVPEGSLLGIGALTTAKVFHASFVPDPGNSIICNQPLDVLYGANGILLGGLNRVENPYNSIDGNENTAAIIRANVSALNETSLTAVYPALSRAKDSIRLVIEKENPGLLDLNLITNSMGIQTFTDNNLAESLSLNPSFLQLRLLPGNSTKYVLTYPTTKAFNKIKVAIGVGVANVLEGLKVYEIGRVAPKPTVSTPGLTNNILTTCEGSQIKLTISQPESNATYKWFDESGAPITTGLANNGTEFTTNALIAKTHTYYVAVYRNGCTDAASEQTKITIIATPAAKASDFTVQDNAICNDGQPNNFLLAPQLVSGTNITNPVFTWYFDENRTRPITNGTVENGITYTFDNDGKLLMNGAPASKSFYISLKGNNICETPAGGLKKINFVVTQVQPATIDLAGNQTIGTGGSVTFTANSPDALEYIWYKDGVQLTETSNKFTINNAAATDAGDYTVKVKGTSGCFSQTSTAVTLSVGGFGSTKTVSGLNANSKIDAGSTLTYHISINNTGSTTLTNITITDPIPTGTSYVQNSASHSGSLNGNTLTWDNLSVNAGDNLTVSFEVSIPNDLTTIPSIGNKAKIEVGSTNEIQEPEITPIATEQIRAFDAKKTLDPTSLNANGKIDAGAELTYKIEVENKGTVILDNISITDNIPNGTTYVSDNHGGILTGNTVNWILDIPVGSTATILLKVKVDDNLTNLPSIVNAALITDPTDPGNPKNPSTPPTDTDGKRDFTASKKDNIAPGTKVAPGDIITYTISVENTGNIDIKNLSIVDLIPVGTTYENGSATDAPVFSSNTLTWTIDLGVGAAKDITFNVKVNSDLTGIPSIGNTATITDPEKPNDPKNPTTPPNDTDQKRSYDVSKTVSGLDNNNMIVSGSQLTYTISVINKGNVKLEDIAITDQLPNGTTFLEASDLGTENAGTVSWTIDVPVGETKNVTLKVKIDNDLTGITKIGNIAIIKDPVDPTDPTESNPKTAEDGPKDTKNSSFNVSGSIVANTTSGDAEPNSELTITINVENVGNVPLNNTTIESFIPSYTSYVPNSGGSYDANSLIVSHTIPNIPVGQSESFTFKVQTNADLSNATKITSTSYITIEGSRKVQVSQINVECPTTQVGTVTVTGKTGTTVCINQQNKVEIIATAALQLTNPTYYLYENGTLVASSQDGIFNISVNVNQHYSYKVAVSANGYCTTKAADMKTIDFDVVPLPLAPNVKSSGINICAGQSVTLEVDNPNSNYTYNWYEGTDFKKSGTTYAVSPNSTKTYYVEAVSAAGCTSVDRNSVVVTVNTVPLVPVTKLSAITICANSTAVLEINNPLANHTYVWYDENNNQLTTGSTYTTATLNASAQYFVEAITNGNCNSSSKATITVTVVATPLAPASLTVQNAGAVCSGSGTTISVDNPVNGIEYKWYNDKTGGTAIYTGTSYSTGNITENKTYYVEAVTTNGCTSTTRTAVTINVIAKLNTPIAKVLDRTTNSVTFSWNAIATALAYEVSIDGGLTWIQASSGANGITHTVTGLKPGEIISFSVRALGSSACEQSAGSALVDGDINNPIGNDVFIPNAFTPNNDGQNDIFLIYGNTLDKVNMKVFNQWGQLIFESNQTGKGWDGTFKGQAQPSGVYVYLVDIGFYDGSKTTKKGTVTLIR
ncbi:gliding motility-associated C-terminal domain-containing protein [Pseudopedobacter beijingensis]|uniref:Gliding motility-associated C-terminal domain-containing protein n=1 Tax=Pseudopedobacter beijingensis TaxID=1207056 RepID=A0ABW4IH00_9SPHI